VSESFVFSKISPINSIINPDTEEKEYLDKMAPFSFFDFLKNINANLSPLQLNDLYVDYIKKWNLQKKNTEEESNNVIQDRYLSLLKDITLKYSTLDEKRFLSNIDFNDPCDLDIIIPFYSKKIREVCDFYSQKRENLKFKIEKNKIKGIPVSLEKAVYETITDVVFSDVMEIGTYQKLVDERDLLTDLNIEIEELYDLYTSYLDNHPDESYTTYEVKTELRKRLFSANLNSIDANIFINFDKAVTNQLFENVRVFLTELGRIFTINYDLNSVNLNCKPDEKLFDLVSNNKPKAERLVKLKGDLIKKYIGCDFYYITTGTTITDVTSAVLFKADNPSGNLLNRHFPTTATIEEESDLQSCRRIGLFFTPEKNGILYYSVPDKKYKIDESKLEANKLYIFPDPNRYGNTVGLSRVFDTEYPLIHIADYSRSIKNESCFSVEGDINSNPFSQDFYAYFSKNQLHNNLTTNEKGLKTNFSELYDKGVLVKWGTDIYGNQYGLFKNKSKSNLVDKTTITSLSVDVCEYYDGGVIRFFQNGKLPEPVLMGDPKWVDPNVYSSDYYYNIGIEGSVGGYYEGMMERGLSGANSSFKPDFNNNYILSSLKYKEFDAGFITDTCEETFDFETQTKFVLNERLTTGFTVTSNNVEDDNQNFYDLNKSYGTMYVRDVVSGEVKTLLNALSVQFESKYNDDFSEILDFNIFNDFIWIRTKNNLIFEKIKYEENNFVYSGTSNNSFDTGYIDGFMYNVSNPFIFEKGDYSMVATLSVSGQESNNFYIIPTIYKIDYNTCNKTKINSSIELSFYKNDSKFNDIKLFRINQPILTYNSRNNLYCVLATVEDENEFSYIYQIKFTYNGSEISNQDIKFYNFSGTEVFKTINFADNPSFAGNGMTITDINTNASKNFNQGILTFS
jgi:hypothetical protein